MTKTKKRENSIISQRVWQGKREYTVHGVGTLILDPDKASAEVRAHAMGYGLDVRVTRAAALSVDRETGKSATPQEKYDAMARVVEHINSGSTSWDMKPAAAPGVDAGLVIQAVMRVYGKTLEAVEALIAASMAKRGLDRTGALKLWASAEKIAKMMLVIKTERITSSIDSDELLDEMESEVGDETDEQDGDE